MPQLVRRAAASLWRDAPIVARDLLSLGIDLAQFVPVPALDVVGSVLLHIWDAIQTVKVSHQGYMPPFWLELTSILLEQQESMSASDGAMRKLTDHPLQSFGHGPDSRRCQNRQRSGG